MRARLASLVLATAALALAAPGPAAAAARPVFRLSDPRLDEVSGIAAGIASPGVLYVENDGGDAARFFALSASSGAVLAQYDVPGATNVDWEDIAVARDASGRASVWLADTGDNARRRSSVVIYRVDEPHDNNRHRSGVATDTSAPDVWKLRYPSGPVDTESLAVSPQGVPYLVTKAVDGRSVVYAAPAEPDSNAVRTVRRVGTITFHFTGTPGPFPPIGELTATGASWSPDGRRFAVRTYTDAYVWPVRNGLAAALHTRPVRIALPRQPQGEGICFAGDSLLIDSEHAGSAVYRVPAPRFPDSSHGSSSAPVSSAPVTSTPRVSPAAEREPAGQNDTATYTLAGVAAGAALAVGIAAVIRRRRS